MQTERTTIEKAFIWWNGLPRNTQQQYCLKYEHLIKECHVSKEMMEEVYKKENIHKEEDKGAIVGLEEFVKNKYPDGTTPGYIDHWNISAQKYFKEGAEWHNSTHCLPLLELATKLLNVVKSYKTLVGNDGFLIRKESAAILHDESSILIEKANKLIK